MLLDSLGISISLRRKLNAFITTDRDGNECYAYTDRDADFLLPSCSNFVTLNHARSLQPELCNERVFLENQALDFPMSFVS